MIGLKCQPLCKHFIPEIGGCNIFKAQEKYIETGKCDEFEVTSGTQTRPVDWNRCVKTPKHERYMHEVIEI